MDKQQLSIIEKAFLFPVVAAVWISYNLGKLYWHVLKFQFGGQQRMAKVIVKALRHPWVIWFATETGQVGGLQMIERMMQSQAQGRDVEQAIKESGTPPSVTPEQMALLHFLQGFFTQALLHFMDCEFDDVTPGRAFAEWTWAGFPREFLSLRREGPSKLVEIYQKANFYRDLLAPRFPTFEKLILDFCAYTPEDEESHAAE